MNNYYDEKLIERFWAKVNIIEDDHSCWNWKASKNNKGYGTFFTGKKENGKPRIENAHRIAYKIEYGEIPEGLHVLHSCDNPSCCNPNHLFLGTYQDNMNDKVRKGRQAKGDENGKSKLSLNQVMEIKNLYATGEYSCRKLSKLFPVSYSHIAKIIKDEYWNLPLAK